MGKIMAKTLPRRAAREQSFALLFALSFQPGARMEEVIAWAADGGALEQDKRAAQTALLAEAHLEEIDALIEKNLHGWRISRISRVALALLRLAVCEMLFVEAVPVGASINEAVELAKLYGDAEVPRFINGVLGSIARERTEQGG
ncbi:MAG: transcription antitermination factor NusB [Oscillospiraceae bacterium]|jgi:N utilization substance protein B|nr:transcription antitermination factor NusB [Oscillospiraceae bacterium]